MNPCADHLHQRHINTLWNRPMTHSDAGPFRIPPIILSLSPPPLSLHAHTHRYTHTHVDRFSEENNSAHEHPRRFAAHSGSPAQTATPPLPVLPPPPPVQVTAHDDDDDVLPRQRQEVGGSTGGGRKPAAKRRGRDLPSAPITLILKGAGIRLLLRRCGCWWIIASPPCSFVRDVCLPSFLASFLPFLSFLPLSSGFNATCRENAA